MKKFSTLLKTLLVGLFACGAMSAWADEGDVLYSNDFSEKDQNDFASWIANAKVPAGYTYTQLGRLGTFSIETGALVNIPATGKNNSNVYNGNFGIFTETITNATKTRNYILSFDITLTILNHYGYNSIFEISGEDKKTVVCLYASHTRKDSSTGSTSYGYIVGGNNAFATKDPTFTTKTNTEGSWGDGTKVEIENVSELTGSKTFHVTLNAQTFGDAKLTIKEDETIVIDENISITPENGLKYIYLTNCNYQNGTQVSSITLDNLSIVEGAATTAETADYLVKYVAEISGVETEIQESSTRTGVVGKNITLLDSDKNNIMFNDVKYIYSSDDANEKTIDNDGSSVVTVTFTEAPSYTYNVVDNLGNELANGSSYEGENVDFYVPYYVYKDGKFYKSPSLSSGKLSYGKATLSNISANTNITVTYTEEESTNVVFFSEAENLTDVTPYEDNYTQIRMSNGKAGYYQTQAAFVTLPAGIYTLTAATRSGVTTFYAGAVGEGKEIGSVTSSGAVATTTSDPFILAGETDIYTSVGNETKYFDYVIIRKTGDLPENVTTTIGTKGYTTFASEVAVEIPAGVTAYKAKINDDKSAVIFSKIEGTQIPANTGVLLEGKAGELTLSVVQSTATLNDNEFKVNTSGTTFPASENTTYFAMVKDSDPLTFGTVNPESVAIPANKAYLAVTKTDATRLTVTFNGETTGIKTLESSVDTKSIYNLNGQRVEKAQKGLYITNGKKTIVK